MMSMATHVDALLLRREKAVLAAIRQVHLLIAVAQCAGEGDDTLPAQLQRFGRPECVPVRVVRGIGGWLRINAPLKT